MHVQCFCTVYLVFLRYTSTVPFCWATLSFFFFFLFFFLFNKFWIVATVPSWFNQLCWAKIHYFTYNFFRLTFCIFFSLHTILSNVVNTVPYRPVRPEYTVPAGNPVRLTSMFRTGRNTGRTSLVPANFGQYRPVQKKVFFFFLSFVIFEFLLG